MLTESEEISFQSAASSSDYDFKTFSAGQIAIRDWHALIEKGSQMSVDGNEPWPPWQQITVEGPRGSGSVTCKDLQSVAHRAE